MATLILVTVLAGVMLGILRALLHLTLGIRAMFLFDAVLWTAGAAVAFSFSSPISGLVCAFFALLGSLGVFREKKS